MPQTTHIHRCGFLLAYEDDEGRVLIHVGGPQLIQPLNLADVQELVDSLSAWVHIKECGTDDGDGPQPWIQAR
jgi:hypothetical protein